MKKLFLFLLLPSFIGLQAQTNIQVINIEADQILKGNYSPANYQPSNVVNDPHVIAAEINQRVNADSLKNYIIKLASFQNRNTGADTVSNVTGMGAARRWVHAKFGAFGVANENRLIPAYLQFDQDICGMGQHRNVLGVLPGSDTSSKEVIVIEGHLDSRCGTGCDINCKAEGVEDNATGTALVIELARVMSKYTYKNTIVFMATTGEEQGLLGANAFARYSFDQKIKIKAVLNNDVIGGVICGKTSSEPSCPCEDDVDSTQVRLFSFGGFNSKWKQLARFLKLQYQEELLPNVKVPMQLTIMTLEDRQGRGGDHIPFRRNGFASMRFTSANEHGNVDVTDPDYTDRQHTSDDILGVDTDNDNIIDSFFVDFNYLARNAVINGVGASMAALGPKTPDLNLSVFHGRRLIVEITDQTQYQTYRVAVRSETNDWDSVYTTNQLLDTFYPPDRSIYIVSVASVDGNGVESLFSREITANPTYIQKLQQENRGLILLQNQPNPFDLATTLSVKSDGTIQYKTAYILIRDVQGKEVKRMSIGLENEMNEVVFTYPYGKRGVYTYSLVIDGKVHSAKQMIFAN
ncbi:M28 family peptidase [Bacteroidia bacterium]|nr:M28 family peptidase [Bacteroidia bacterium]